jgi:hypothetical protein
MESMEVRILSGAPNIINGQHIMTYQEALWKGKRVLIVSLMSKNGRIHRYVKRHIGRDGIVLGEAKNNMLLIQFRNHARAIPAGCVVDYNTAKCV